MMTLSLMQEVVSTVSDQWESPLADEILQHWEHDSGRAKYWRASSNFVFFFKKSGQGYVLRFNHAEERSAEVIRAEIDYVNELARKGLRVAKPMCSRAGNYVESVDTAHGLFHAVVFEALAGEQIELDELTPDQFTRWGQALGELHNASAQYVTHGRPIWEDHLTFVAETLPAVEKRALQALDELKKQLSQLTINDQNFGLIHYDFELDNLIWDGEQPGIIDFDDSAWYWFAADIALALGDLFEESAGTVDLQNESFLQFIEGYRRVRPVDQEELDLIPLFLRVDHMITFAKLYRTMTPINPAGELPWMAELRDKLSTKMQFYRDEFSA